MSTSTQLPPLAIYHYQCFDGLAAAWVFKLFNPTGEISPGIYNNSFLPPNIDGRIVYLLDFCFKKDLMVELMKRASRVIVLDHHATAKPVIDELKVDNCFTLTMSGAGIAWHYFSSRAYTFHKDMPLFIQYIQDRDLWTYKLPNSKAITKAMYSLYPLSFDSFDAWMKEFDAMKLITEGEVLLKSEDNIMESLEKDAVLTMFEGYKVYLVPGPFVFRSDLGNRLALKPECDFVALYTYVYSKDYYSVSFRGVEEKGIDLSKIAAKYGGGGHSLSSGAKLNGINSLREAFKPLSHPL